MTQQRQVVAVTGASGGIGRASAIAFGRRGAAVALVARGSEGLEAAASEVEKAGGMAQALGLGLAPIWTLILAAVGIVVQLALARAYNFNWRRSPRRVYLWRRRSAV